MKKIAISTIIVLVLAIPAFANYNFEVSGKVTIKPLGKAVDGATVKLTIDWGSIITTHSTTSKSDGSYKIKVSNSSVDFKGKKMTLRATQNMPYATGGRQWYCQSYSVDKDVSIAVVIFGREGLIARADPSQFIMPGEVIASPVMVYDPAHLDITNFQVTLGFDVESVQFNHAVIKPDSNFEIIEQTLVEPGKVVVSGQTKDGLPKQIPDFPAESFFDVFFDVILPSELTPVVSSLAVTEETELINGPDIHQPYPFESDFMIGEAQTCQPYLLIDDYEQWQEKLNSEWPKPSIRPFSVADWDDYWQQIQQHLEQGIPYPETQFLPPELYVYEGDGEPGNNEPDDAGLVMKWGEQEEEGNYASAWKYDYGLDPDLSNSIITVQVTPPSASGITQISLGLQDIAGNIRSWWWNVPSDIPHNIPTVVTIDTTLPGWTATNPPASGFANNPAFDITKVQQIMADENAAWIASSGVPAPGQTLPAIWNYWYNLKVTPKLPGGQTNSKWFLKYSQPPVEQPDEPGKIIGWDEISIYNSQTPYPIMADDWECKDQRPVTDIHWWGSFKGWSQPYLPPITPTAFHIGIWSDVPAGVDKPYSHPGVLLWENTCNCAVWNFAGYDVDPRCDNENYPCEENETCFQWAQFLSQDQWFRQKPMEDGIPNIYWLSIAAIYPADTDFSSPKFYPWGWKTREHKFMDDAIRIEDLDSLPLTVGTNWLAGTPVEFPEGISWDLAFELTTNEPAYEQEPIPGDISGPNNLPDGIVNMLDLKEIADNWLVTAP